MELIAAILLALGALAVLALALRLVAARAEWARLAALQPADPEGFAAKSLSGLPEPARRYFTHPIRPGTPRLPVPEIEMGGRFGLGMRKDPRLQPMRARQILAAPEGFLWKMRTRGGMRLSGSDSGRWTRFRLWGLVPVVRRGGDADHARSAFGRCVAEAVIRAPAALLPGTGATWEAVDGDTARVTVRRGDLAQAVDVALDREGCPRQVSFRRWSDANPDKVFRRQPFGGYLSDFREVAGYRLPFRVEAGNMFGTDAYFPFFQAEVTAIRFPRARP